MRSLLVRRALLSTVAAASIIGVAACGSSGSPVSSNTTVASSTTTTPPTTTAASTTTTAPTTPPTTTKKHKASGGGGSAKDNPAADRRFCTALASHAQELISAGKRVSSATDITSKPSKQLVSSLQALAKVFDEVKPLAPAAVKKDITVADKGYDALAKAFASGSLSQRVKASQDFENSNATNDLLNMETWETKHCS